jgi:cell division protein FtsQ
MDGQRRFARSLRIARRRFWSKLKPAQPPRALRAASRASAIAFMLAAISLGLVDGGHVALRDAKGLGPVDWTAARLGYAAVNIEISGLKYHTPEQVLQLIETTPGESLLGFDSLNARQRLEKSDWVKSAEVQRVYPNRLKVNVTEREPFAVWRRKSEYSVIDRDGSVLSGIDLSAVRHLPLVTGEGANRAATRHLDALSKVQGLHLRTKGSAFVGGRRWSVYLDNGVKIMLPEQDALKALQQVERIEDKTKFLSKAIVAVDLRFPGRMNVQLPEGYIDEALRAHAMMRRTEQ